MSWIFGVEKNADLFSLVRKNMASGVLSILIAGTYLAPAHAQMNSREAASLQSQVTELRQELNQLQLQSGGGQSDEDSDSDDDHSVSSGRNNLVAQLLQRINELEEQQRTMRGELDQLKYQVEQQSAAVNKQISDMNFAAQQKGGDGAAAAAVTGSAAGVATGNTTSSLGTVSAPPPAASAAPNRAESPLKAAETALNKRDFSSAETYAQQGLSSAHTSTAQADAYYLLGRSYSGQKDYGQAAVSYYKSYSKAPKSLKAQHALIGLSLALLAQNSKRESCQALAKLRAEFPSMAPSVKSAEMSVRKRAGCS